MFHNNNHVEREQTNFIIKTSDDRLLTTSIITVTIITATATSIITITIITVTSNITATATSIITITIITVTSIITITIFTVTATSIITITIITVTSTITITIFTVTVTSIITITIITVTVVSLVSSGYVASEQTKEKTPRPTIRLLLCMYLLPYNVFTEPLLSNLEANFNILTLPSSQHLKPQCKIDMDINISLWSIPTHYSP
jgi:hypothetical protein